MDLSAIQPLLDWIAAHPNLAGLVVFAIAAAESLAVVGILVPGVVFMLGVGAMVGLGALDLWSTLLWAALGAVVGDGVSYWLGRHFDRQLRSMWPFTKHQELIPRGERFFRKHGGASILFGRFVGPIRPVIPAIAGIMHMNPWYFSVVNVVSAIAWAPVVILPGVAFGTSLHMATEVAGRLVVLFLIFIGLVWLAIILVRKLIMPILLKIFSKWEEQWDFLLRNAFNSGIALLLIIITAAGTYTVYSMEEAQESSFDNFSKQSWRQGGWQQLPVYRRAAKSTGPLVLQGWGGLELLKQTLLNAGWIEANPLSMLNAIQWLSPSLTMEKYPILRRSLHGNHESLILVKPLNSQQNSEKQSPRQQLVLRVWPLNGDQDQSPLWLGNVSVMALTEPLPDFYFPKTSGNINKALTLFTESVNFTNSKLVTQQRFRENLQTDYQWDGLVLLVWPA